MNKYIWFYNRNIYCRCKKNESAYKYNKKCCTFQQSRLEKLYMLHLQFEIVKYWCSPKLFLKKGENMVIIWGFLHFPFWKKSLYTLFVQWGNLSSNNFFIYLEVKCRRFSTNTIFPLDKIITKVFKSYH